MTASRTACVVLNPHAGNAGDRAQVDEAVAIWRQHDWQVEVAPTEYAGHAVELAAAAARRGDDIVVAAGGDGTVNEVVNGLAGTASALAVLPVGTGNVWVRELGLPLDPRAAAEAQLHGAVRRLDLGRAGSRYFLLMAGIGFDAEVTRQVDPATKRRLGLIAYVVHALDVGRRVRGTPIRMVLDGRPVRGRALQVVVGNSRLYGGFLQIAHQASPTDGLLDVVVIKGGDMRVAPLHMLSILLRQYHFNPDLAYYRARRIAIASMTPLDVQVDGDTIGQTPMEFVVAPGALHALLPRERLSSLATWRAPTGSRWRTLRRELKRRVQRAT